MLWGMLQCTFVVLLALLFPMELVLFPSLAMCKPPDFSSSTIRWPLPLACTVLRSSCWTRYHFDSYCSHDLSCYYFCISLAYKRFYCYLAFPTMSLLSLALLIYPVTRICFLFQPVMRTMSLSQSSYHLSLWVTVYLALSNRVAVRPPWPGPWSL